MSGDRRRNYSGDYRKIYEHHYGKIPVDGEGRTYDIHHIDGDHSNHHPSNLKAVTIQEHYDIHHSIGDFKSCLIMSARMKISPEEKSRLSKLANAERVANGTHHWQDSDKASERNKKLLSEGKHIFQDPSFQAEMGIRGGVALSKKRELDAQLDKKIKSVCSENGKKVKGSYWITDGVNTKMIKTDDIPEGWRRGRRENGTYWITNGVNSKIIESTDIIPEGWKKGRK